MSIDSTVLSDAARMLGVAQRKLQTLAKTTQCTPEYERKIVVEVMANINAAVARIQSGE